AAAVDAPVPAVHRVAGHRERALVEREVLVEQGRVVELGDRSPALTGRAHAAGDRELPALLRRHAALLEGDGTGTTDRGDVEAERLGRTDVRFAEAAEEDAQQGADVGGGADRRSRVGAHAFLIDDDRG